MNYSLLLDEEILKFFAGGIGSGMKSVKRFSEYLASIGYLNTVVGNSN